MKISRHFTLFILVFTFGCGHVQSKKSTSPKSVEDILTVDLHSQDEDVDSDLVEKDHELVEVIADDKEIQQTVGASEIDEEIPGTPNTSDEKNPIPFLLPKNTRRMQFWVNYFTQKDRDRFQRFINNGEEYRPLIEEILDEYNLPRELYFVGLIESGYNLRAKSRARAVGPWQFIRATGKRYGLRISSEIDERRDLFKATHAAARYLRDLHNVFSSWELALSAYNAGEYGILRRIMKHKSRDYYVLSKRKNLPSETINYVPKVLAAMHIFRNAKEYGFTIPNKETRVFDNTDLRPVKRNLSLYKISRELKISVKTLRELNPALRKNKTPRFYSGLYHLRVPKEVGSLMEAPTFRETRKDLIRRTAETFYHRTKRGDTLLKIARKYGTSAGEIARLNNLRSWKSKIKVGQQLKVRGDSAKRKNTRPIVYKVRPGDNLSSLAKLFRTRASRIKKANKLRSNKIYVGQKLVLPNTKRGVYTVRRGDYLSKIARKFNQPLEAILKLNKLKRKKIYPGQKIIVDID